MTNADRRKYYIDWAENRTNWSVGSKAFSPDDINPSTPIDSRGYRERTGIYGTYYGSYITDNGKGFSAEPNKNYADDSPQVVNINYIYKYLTNKGWHPNAAIAVIGNIQAECGLNPGRWQYGGYGSTGSAVGFGLVQWTPGSKKHIAWCMGYRWKKNSNTGVWEYNVNDYNNGLIRYTDPSSMDSQLAHLIEEMDPDNTKEGGNASQYGSWAGEWWHSSHYPLSKRNFITATDKNGNSLSAEYLTKAFVVNYLRPQYYETHEKQKERVTHTEIISKYILQVQSFKPKTTNDSNGVIENPIEPCYKMNRVGDGYDRAPGEGNCTWYAYGRAWEITAECRGEKPSSSNEPTYLRNRGNAGDWYRRLAKDTNFPQNRLSKDTPKPGAIVCWLSNSKGKEEIGWGHVAVVEEITYDENHNWVSFQYSHSGYRSPTFGVGNYKRSSDHYGNFTDYKLQGFIYLDVETDKSTILKWYPINKITQFNDKLTLNMAPTNELPEEVDTTLTWLFPQILSNYGDKANIVSKDVRFQLHNNENISSVDIPIPPFAEGFYINMVGYNANKEKQKDFKLFDNVTITYPCVHIYNDGETIPYVPLMYKNNKWEPKIPYVCFNNKFYPIKTRCNLTELYTRPETFMLGVSRYMQTDYYFCGTASVATILQYKNIPLPSNISMAYDRYLYHNVLGITHDEGLMTYQVTELLNKYLGGTPYSTLLYTDTNNKDKLMKVLEGSITNNFPVVALIRIDDKTHFTYTTTGHFLVIDGINKATEEIHIVDPSQGGKPYVTMSITDFIDRYYVQGQNPYRLVAHIPK